MLRQKLLVLVLFISFFGLSLASQPANASIAGDYINIDTVHVRWSGYMFLGIRDCGNGYRFWDGTPNSCTYRMQVQYSTSSTCTNFQNLYTSVVENIHGNYL